MARLSIEKGISYDDKKKLFYVTLSHKTVNGKKPKSVKTAHTKTEARAIRREFLQQKALGKVNPPSPDTLVESLRHYIDYKSLTCAESTIYGYKNILENHVEPYFKKQKIGKVTARDLEKYIISLSSKLSSNTIKKHTDLLFPVFENALKRGIITVNPFTQMDRLKTQSHEKTCYDANEAQLLLAAIKGTQIELPVYLALFLGMRRGEIAGLKWEHIDFENRTLTVANTRTQVGSSIVEKQPKTQKSSRTYRIYEPVYSMLLAERDREPVSKDMTKRVARSKYVACMSNGKPFRPNYISDLFKKTLENAGLKQIAFHDLRHSYASIAKAAGADIFEISTSLGHANVNVTTSVYLHEFDPVKKAAPEKVAEALTKPNRK